MWRRTRLRLRSRPAPFYLRQAQPSDAIDGSLHACGERQGLDRDTVSDLTGRRADEDRVKIRIHQHEHALVRGDQSQVVDLFEPRGDLAGLVVPRLISPLLALIEATIVASLETASNSCHPPGANGRTRAAKVWP